MNLKTKLIVVTVVLAITLGPLSLFWAQNSSRVTDLSLNMGFYATELAAPVSVPALMAVTFAVGLVVGMIAMAMMRRRGTTNVPAPVVGAGQADPWT